MNDNTLKQCPFCGGETYVCEGGINGRMTTYGLVEHKDGCFFLADGLPSKNQHVMENDFEAWNTRAERTCMVSIGEGDRKGWWVCDSCGDMFDSLSGLACKKNKKPNYCQNCGRKVVDA